VPTPDEVRAETEAAIRAGGDAEEDLDLSYIDEELIASLSSYRELSDEELDAEIRRQVAEEDPEAEVRPEEGEEGERVPSWTGWNVVVQGRLAFFNSATFVWRPNGQTAYLCFYTGNVRAFSRISGRIATCHQSSIGIRRIYG
jgi:hypothetical protein